jgi:hypothetical protein
MWYKSCLLTILLASSCGDDGAAGHTEDLSAAEDLLMLQDFALSQDLTPARCALPAPMVYDEIVQYMWTQVGAGAGGGGGLPQSAYSITPVAMRGDGAIVRTSSPLTSPDRFSCSFTEKNIDPLSCTAPCCPGTALSPVVYVDGKGWSIWVTGSCSLTIGTTQYVVNVNRVNTQPAH